MKNLLTIIAAFLVLAIPLVAGQGTQSLTTVGDGQVITAGATSITDYALTFTTGYGALKGTIAGEDYIYDVDEISIIWTETADTNGQIWISEYCETGGVLCSPDWASYTTVVSGFATLTDICGPGTSYITEQGTMNYLDGPGSPTDIYRTDLSAGPDCNYAMISDSVAQHYGSPVENPNKFIVWFVEPA